MNSLRTFSLALITMLLAAACSSTDPEAPDTSWYVAVGDSYTSGYMPRGADGPGPSTHAYPRLVERKSRTTATPLELINFGCAGITARTLLEGGPCGNDSRALDAPDPGAGSQLDAVIDFLREHDEDIGLVTINVGMADVVDCLTATDFDGCLDDRLDDVSQTLSEIVDRIRAEVGRGVSIIGVGYPNPYRVLPYLEPGDRNDLLAERSRTMTAAVTPTLKKIFNDRGAEFIDVADLSGANEPDSKTVNTTTWGEVPVAVSQVCSYTWFCEVQDVHLTPEGMQGVANEIMRLWPVS